MCRMRRIQPRLQWISLRAGCAPQRRSHDAHVRYHPLYHPPYHPPLPPTPTTHAHVRHQLRHLFWTISRAHYTTAHLLIHLVYMRIGCRLVLANRCHHQFPEIRQFMAFRAIVGSSPDGYAKPSQLTQVGDMKASCLWLSLAYFPASYTRWTMYASPSGDQ